MSKRRRLKLVSSQRRLVGPAFDGAVLTVLQAHGSMTARTIADRMRDTTSRVAWALHRLVKQRKVLSTWTPNKRECIYTPRVRKRSVRLVGARRSAAR